VIDAERLVRDFEAKFGRRPRLYRAPGRVNLIGEHTDYNDGLVLPIAIDRSTWVAAAPRSDRTLVVSSDAYADTVRIDLDDVRANISAFPHSVVEAELARSLEQSRDHSPKPGASESRPPTRHWSDYVRGVAAVLDDGRRLRGADLLIRTDVPVGAGLSSSAALEVACGFALEDLSRCQGFSPDRAELTALARACQRAEHEFVGTRCGLMDQFAACHGRAGQALQLDTRTMGCEWVPLPSAVRVMVARTAPAVTLVRSLASIRVTTAASAEPTVIGWAVRTAEPASTSIRSARRCRTR